MLQFATPLGLIALGALLAPILIHLVRRPRRVVRVGDLRPLTGNTRRRHSRRWQDGLLLALRCALLAALALALAGLNWQPRHPAPVRWLLRVPGTALQGANLAAWERWRADGFEARWLAPGLPAAEAPAPADARPPDAWSLLREADAMAPAGSRAVVFGPTDARLLTGPRPELSRLAVTWHRVEAAPAAPAPRREFRVALAAATDRAADAAALRAALTASGADVGEDDRADVYFKLGDASVPAAWEEQVRRGAWLVSDAPAAAPAAEVFRHLPLGDRAPALRRRTPAPPGAPLFRDSAGEPWLTEERHGAGRHWRLALRFHPAWSDWTLGGAFPRWWREQLGLAPDVPVTVAPEQAAPGFAPATGGTRAAVAAGPGSDLRGWCWAVAVALLIAERVLNRRARRERETS